MTKKTLVLQMGKWYIFLICTVLLFFHSTDSISATTGKIAGVVSDAQTGEKLPGVNVQIVDTDLGAATDLEGAYYIINIPPGTYTLKASYMGYTSVVTTNVRVQVNRTTTIDLELESTVIEGQEVTVVSERPVIEHDVTGTEISMNSDDLNRAPIVSFMDAIEQQRGFYSTGDATYVRGGLMNEVNYSVDGVSVNSGLMQDNWQKMNTSAIQEVNIITGGYNAEYGNAMSGIVNVVTKEASRQSQNTHGNINYTYRPAGQYHWGKNLYDESLWKYTHYDLAYWQEQLESVDNQNSYKEYFDYAYGWDGETVPTAQQLLDTYQSQITPQPVLGDYAERGQHEIEGSVYGALTSKLSYLLSGRYKRGVHIYPSAQDYQPEYNIQAKVNYFLNDNMKLSLNVLNGWYRIAAMTASDFNTMSWGRDAGERVRSGEIRSPYDGQAYSPWGAGRIKGPEEKNVNMFNLTWQHTINPASFYTVRLSYYQDDLSALQDYSHNADYPFVELGDRFRDLTEQFNLIYRRDHYNFKLLSKVFSAKTDYTNQISKSHQIKTGAEFEMHDLEHRAIRVSYRSESNIPITDNMFTGKPVVAAFYVQDKMEYEGIVLNLGVRLDGFDVRHNYPESPLYDPFAVQEIRGGDGKTIQNTEENWWANEPVLDWYMIPTTDDYRPLFDGKRKNLNTQESEWKFALAPRLGVSFPITDNSQIRFSYGHFYQRPSWNKMYGRTYQWVDANPLESIAERSMGWQGHPGLTYEKTVQYEVGYNQSILDMFRLNVTAYYKDATRLTRFSANTPYTRGGGFATGDRVNTYTETRSFDNSIRIRTMANDAYKDVRGLEFNLEKMFSSSWAARVTFDYSLVSGAKYGFHTIYQDPSKAYRYTNPNEVSMDWISDYKIKADVSYLTNADLGPRSILGNILAAVHFEYFAGPKYTWYPKDYTGVPEPFNKRWYPHNVVDLRLSKRIKIAGLTSNIGLDIQNLFNYYDRQLLGGTELDDWEESGQMPIESDSGESDVWNFYNSIATPKRMIYLMLGFEF